MNGIEIITSALSHKCARLGNWLSEVYTRGMTKRSHSVPAFMTAWLFAFSLLSNCYCLPTGQAGAPVSTVSKHSAQMGMQSEMPAHCQHHSGAAKDKTSGCAPRFNSDHFESTNSQTYFDLKVQGETFVAPETLFLPNFLFERTSVFHVLAASSSPRLYLLHHSFLI